MMAQWRWPRPLALAVLLVLALSSWLQSAGGGMAVVRAAALPLVHCWGPLFAHVVLGGALALLRTLPHLGVLDAQSVRDWGGTFLRVCLEWSARAAVHLVALSLWLGCLLPVARVLARIRKSTGATVSGLVGGVPAPLAQLQRPLWCRAMGVLPLATLLWCCSGPGTLFLAPWWAALWLFAAAALWQPWLPAH